MLQLLFQITQLLSLLLNHLMIALGRLLELLDLRLQPILLVRHHGELALRPLQVHLHVLNTLKTGWSDMFSPVICVP